MLDVELVIAELTCQGIEQLDHPRQGLDGVLPGPVLALVTGIELVSVHVIPRPHEQLQLILPPMEKPKDGPAAKTGGTGLRDVPLAIHRGRAGSRPIYTGGYFWGTVTYGSSTTDDVLNGDAMMIQLSDTTQVDFSTALRAPQAAAWQLYPVPATDRLHVNAPEPLRTVVVYDALGATVAVPREGINTLLVAALHPGMYLLRATTVGGAVYTLRFAKE